MNRGLSLIPYPLSWIRDRILKLGQESLKIQKPRMKVLDAYYAYYASLSLGVAESKGYFEQGMARG